MSWLTAAGTLVSAYAAYKAGQDQEDYYDKAGEASEADADAQRQASLRAAEILRERGARQIVAERKAGRKITASARAAYSKAGVKLIGTPVEVISQTVRDVERVVKETAHDVEMDALTILEHGTAEASRSVSMADLFRDRGTYAERAGYVGALSTLLTGYSRYEQRDRQYRIEG
jgi:hypothetical protein